MKIITYILPALLTAAGLHAQVAIGKQSINGNSTILDFNDSITNTNGIILPAVTAASTALAANPANNHGTFIYDKSDYKAKMYQNGTWVNLSETGDGAALAANVNTSAEQGKGVIIGAGNSNAKGVLILESTNKAVILPKIVNPAVNVKSPYPGMICYDTTSMSLAVFDGVRWNYWK